MLRGSFENFIVSCRELLLGGSLLSHSCLLHPSLPPLQDSTGLTVGPATVVKGNEQTSEPTARLTYTYSDHELMKCTHSWGLPAMRAHWKPHTQPHQQTYQSIKQRLMSQLMNDKRNIVERISLWMTEVSHKLTIFMFLLHPYNTNILF